MEINTTKETLNVNKMICEKREMLNIQGDMIVPDSKPDILSTINTRGDACIYKKEIMDEKIRLDGNILTKGKPSSEVNMHLEIYKKRPDVYGIVHTHSPYATGFAHSSKSIKRHEGFGEIKTPFIAEIEYEKPGSNELAINASEGLCNEDVLILKKHGVICVGKNLKEAELLAIFVEETAKTQFVTYMLNSVEDII